MMKQYLFTRYLNGKLMKLMLHFILLLVLYISTGYVKSQIVVFSDDFTSNTSPSWTPTGNLNGSDWDVNISGTDWGARRNDMPIQLELSNDISTSTNSSGYCLVSTPASNFLSPYTTTLSNGGMVTWSFNMRQIRTDPSGFNGANYAVAFILAGSTSTNNSSGNGYAVALGGPGGQDSVRLVRYTGGLNAEADLTNLIKSNTEGLTDFGAEYLSIKVTYNPCNGGQWELFLRNDGLTGFANPLTGTLVSQGTIIDNTYTGTSLNMMAAYWKGSTVANQTAFFNNVTVSTTSLPSVTCPNDTTMCSNGLPYVLYGGTPSGGAYAGTGVNAGIFNPAQANPGLNIITYTYSDSNLCADTCSFDIMVNTVTEAIAGTYGPACLNDPDIILNGTPPGGTWTGQGVTDSIFDPNFGTETLTYSYTSFNGCLDSDQTTIEVFPCTDPSTMEWILLSYNEVNGEGCITSVTVTA
jgi:hypothetical protein